MNYTEYTDEETAKLNTVIEAAQHAAYIAGEKSRNQSWDDGLTSEQALLLVGLAEERARNAKIDEMRGDPEYHDVILKREVEFVNLG